MSDCTYDVACSFVLLSACDSLGTQCTLLVIPVRSLVSYRSRPNFIVSYDLHILGVITQATAVRFVFYGP